MIGNALKSVYKYMGLCIIGTLTCTVYAPSAYADICFLPGGDCVTDINDTQTHHRDEVPDTSPSGDREICSITVEPANEQCVHCADGNFKDCHCVSGFERGVSGTCIKSCPRNSTRQANGDCRCSSGMSMCNGECLPNTKVGNFVLNPTTCDYNCQDGYERLTGLEGCYLKCSAGQVHNATTGACECPEGQEKVAVLGDVCKPKCLTGEHRDWQGVCKSNVPSCESPKTWINESIGCKDCSDYVLRDRYSDMYSNGYSDTFSDRYSYSGTTSSESCSVKSTSLTLMSDIRTSGGACSQCATGVNLWKCNIKGYDIRNYADLCYALGYTYTTSNATCSSPFWKTTNADMRAYNSAVNEVKSMLKAWGLAKENIFTGNTCSACPFNSSFYKCDGQCSSHFGTTHGDALYMEDYTCLECPASILVEGAGSTMNMYYCHWNGCKDGTVLDPNCTRESQECCVTQTCGDQGYETLQPIDLCANGTCGLPSAESIVGAISDNVSGGNRKCQFSADAKYTASQAAKLTDAGYACAESIYCPGVYTCKPAVPLAKAVKDNGGTCSECGSNPTKYQCKIGGKKITEPVELCDYLGFTLSSTDYNDYFANDSHVAGCETMACGVYRTQYGYPAAGGMYGGRYKCRCASGYDYTPTGCVKQCNPICGYSDSCSAGDHYSDYYSGCIMPAPIPDPVDPEQKCYKEGFTMFEGDKAFQCGYYTTSTCSLCPYTNNPKMYKCSTGDKNEMCDVGTECWCCMFPDSPDCEVTPPEPGCDDYSQVSYSDMYSDYMAECGKTNRNQCYADGYSDVSPEVLKKAEGCVACPYPHSGNTLYKGCYVPNAADICKRDGYTTSLVMWEPAIRRNEATCSRCPEAPLEWAKDCSYFCESSGYHSTQQTCPSGYKSDIVYLSNGTKCYADCRYSDIYSDSNCDTVSDNYPEPPVVNVCEIGGYYKASSDELYKISSGQLSCDICSSDSSYIKKCSDLAKSCSDAGYKTVDVRGYVSTLLSQGYTCYPCPDSLMYWKCYEPVVPPADPCDGYSTVPCDLTTHQCTDSVSECGCLKCSEPAGTICTKDKQCSQTLNQWDRCEGTCKCTGVTCGTGETCKQTNACGNCVAGQCECPGTKCGENEICRGSTNKCGNCTGTCINKGCPTGYSPTNPGGCPDTVLSGDGTFTCYGNYKKCTCPDGKVESCGADKKPTGEEEDVGGTKCYTCVDKTCSDYGYKDEASCPTGQKAVPQTTGTGLTCYTCAYKTCSDYGYKDRCTNCIKETLTPRTGLTCYTCKACSSGGGGGGGTSGGGTSGGGTSGGGTSGGGTSGGGTSGGGTSGGGSSSGSCSSCCSGTTQISYTGGCSSFNCYNCGNGSGSCSTCCSGTTKINGSGGCGSFNCYNCGDGYSDDNRYGYSDDYSDNISDGISDGVSDDNQCGGCPSNQFCCVYSVTSTCGGDVGTEDEVRHYAKCKSWGEECKNLTASCEVGK